MSVRPAIKERLLKEYPEDQYGVWEIRGEDANADLAGSHHMPTLGYFEGKYGEIVEYALELNRFFTWGGGGDIRPIKTMKIDEDSAWQLRKAKAELKRIEKEKEEIEKRITFLTLKED